MMTGENASADSVRSAVESAQMTPQPKSSSTTRMLRDPAEISLHEDEVRRNAVETLLHMA